MASVKQGGRPFTIADAMILIAATQAAWGRDELSDGGWTQVYSRGMMF